MIAMISEGKLEDRPAQQRSMDAVNQTLLLLDAESMFAQLLHLLMALLVVLCLFEEPPVL